MAAALSPSPFRWRDGDRVIVFGRGAAAGALADLESPYTLLTTGRAAAAAPAVADQAASVITVPAGRVDDLAGDLRGGVAGGSLVALGGGRVIDVAKAIAAADAPKRVAAIPTTLSAAEMTALHRHARGVDSRITPHVRPAVVINDPSVSASQPPAGLAASAANALSHAVEAVASNGASPVPTLVAGHAAALIAQAFPATASGAPGLYEQARDSLALGALLAGYAMDAAGYGLHHVAAQTAVRIGGGGHGPTNAALLPHTLRALRARAPAALAALDAAVGSDLDAVAAGLAARAGASRLRDLDIPHDRLEVIADAASQRPDLAATPPAATREELLALYEAAW